MKRCRSFALRLVPLFLIPLAAGAQQDRPPLLGNETSTRLNRLDVKREESVSVPAMIGPQGPLFSLESLARRFGARLEVSEIGPAHTLYIDDAVFIAGAESDKVVRGTEILPLSRPPVETDTGLLVPIDFLELTFGQVLGYRFRWDPAAEKLEIGRPETLDLEVIVDRVHLQGVTTLVFHFSEPLRYRVDTRSGAVVVDILGAHIRPAFQGPRTPEDPLIRRINLEQERIRIDLRPGAVAENYALTEPFRLVFDVHRSAAGPAAAPPRRRPSRRQRGIRTIAIDPGHGGSETGAVGPGGTKEKDIALILARTLKARLESRMPVRVVLTRTGDADLPLDTRPAIANQNKADLFISIHLNSTAGGTEVAGAETYFLNMQASDERAARAAESENRAAPATGAEGGDGDPLYDLQLMLWDLAQTRHLAESQRLARLIQEELNTTLDLRDRGVKQAPFKVLMGAAMPAVLVELGFISNPAEERKLRQAEYRAELVDSLVRAVARYRAQAKPGAKKDADLLSERRGGVEGRGP